MTEPNNESQHEAVGSEILSGVIDIGDWGPAPSPLPSVNLGKFHQFRSVPDPLALAIWGRRSRPRGRVLLRGYRIRKRRLRRYQAGSVVMTAKG